MDRVIDAADVSKSIIIQFEITTRSADVFSQFVCTLVLKGASFLAKSFLQLRRQHSGSTSKFSVELTFVPNFPSGILFYTGQSGSVTGDFFSLALKSGIVEFRFLFNIQKQSTIHSARFFRLTDISDY